MRASAFTLFHTIAVFSLCAQYTNGANCLVKFSCRSWNNCNTHRMRLWRQLARTEGHRRDKKKLPAAAAAVDNDVWDRGQCAWLTQCLRACVHSEWSVCPNQPAQRLSPFTVVLLLSLLLCACVPCVTREPSLTPDTADHKLLACPCRRLWIFLASLAAEFHVSSFSSFLTMHKSLQLSNVVSQNRIKRQNV